MKDASYFRLLAKQCFDQALDAKSAAEAECFRKQGREYGEAALAADANTGKGAANPHKRTTNDPDRRE
jgi:hypothetical protein